MDKFATFGAKAGYAKSAYAILCRAADAGEPCPSIEAMARDIGMTPSPMRRLLLAMQDADLIVTTVPTIGRRIVKITATGRCTAPTQTSADAAETALAACVAGPKQTMTPSQFLDALTASGRFEDSQMARRDMGSAKQSMPSRVSVTSGCGISQIYGIGGTDQRTIAGSP